jgi:hypothetical protein
MAPPDKAKCQGARVLKSFDSHFERYSSSESEHSDYFSTALAAHWRTRPPPMKPFFFHQPGRQKKSAKNCVYRVPEAGKQYGTMDA